MSKHNDEEQELRYFIVSYFYGKGNLGSGTMGYVSYKFPSYEELRQISKVEGMSIINILEVVKIDYLDFWKEGKF